MKKVLALAVATTVLTAASLASAAGIVGTKHDLSPSGTFSGTKGVSTQICVYCHAPHGAAKTYPLWNRTNPAANLFKLYSGSGMQSRQFQTGFTNDSTSLFCMSCHDGRMTMQSIHNIGALQRNVGLGGAGDAAGAWATGSLSGGPALATSTAGSVGSADLTLTHPINFPVPTVNNSQNDLWVGTEPTKMGGNYADAVNAFPLFAVTNAATGGNNNADRATNRSLECGSCHAVHDSTNSPFLRYTMSGSKLCLGCHNK